MPFICRRTIPIKKPGPSYLRLTPWGEANYPWNGSKHRRSSTVILSLDQIIRKTAPSNRFSKALPPCRWILSIGFRSTVVGYLSPGFPVGHEWLQRLPSSPVILPEPSAVALVSPKATLPTLSSILYTQGWWEKAI